MTNKKYTVFVSSTYEDLKEERSKVISALLQMDCFPVGMEYFNASDRSQWEVIQSLICECDYYVLIIAGKYGTVEPNSGKSYTQLEYEFARLNGVPTIAFLHKNPISLPAINVEKEHEKELTEFRELVSKHMWRHWENADELAGQVVLSLNSLKKTSPRLGWIKADKASSDEANTQILSLKEEIERLNLQIEKENTTAPLGTDKLSQGDDVFAIEFKYNNEFKSSLCKIDCTWNELYSLLAPHLYIEYSDENWAMIFNEHIKSKLAKQLKSLDKVGGVFVLKSSVQMIKTQFIALGLIRESDKKHSTKEGNSFWTLTPYGKHLLVQLSAIRKEIK